MYGAGTPLDPYSTLDLDPTHRPWQGGEAGLVGLIRRSPRIQTGVSACALIIAGQSNGANHMGGTYNVFYDTQVDVLNFRDGGIYPVTTPIVGASGIDGQWLGRLGDILVDNGHYDRVILVPVAVGNTSVSDWSDGNVRNNIITAVRRCRALGLPPRVLWQQGENDTATSQSDYAARLTRVISRSQIDGGPTIPWLLGRSTYNAGGPIATVRAAIASLVNGVSIFDGADTDTLTGTTYRTPELTHFNLAGGQAAAELWRQALIAANLA